MTVTEWGLERSTWADWEAFCERCTDFELDPTGLQWQLYINDLCALVFRRDGTTLLISKIPYHELGSHFSAKIYVPPEVLRRWDRYRFDSGRLGMEKK